jgi:hypothetical protein
VGCRFQLIENKAEKNSLQTGLAGRPGWRRLRREMRVFTYAQDYPQALGAIFSHRYKPRTCRQLLRRVLSISNSAMLTAATFRRGWRPFVAG